MTRTISTIGYEGAAVADFVETLTRTGIKHVLDIRDVPASRRPGFSKTPLSGFLRAAQISYSHLKPLGDPKPGREAMRGGDYNLFLAIYSQHVARPEAQASLADAIAIAAGEPSVLLCYERDPKHCHRTLVADMMKDLASFSVRHLGVVASRRPAHGGRQNGNESRRAVANG